MIKTVFFILTSFFFISSTSARTFTSSKGKTMEASFAGFNKNMVKLILKSGKTIQYPINKLSKQDVEYLKNHPFRNLPSIEIDPKVHYPVHDKMLHTCFIDSKGKITTTHKFRIQSLPKYSGNAFLTETGGIYTSFYDKSGSELLLNSQKLGVYLFNAEWSDTLILTHDPNNNLFGFSDHKGKIAIPIHFTRATQMRSNRAWVQSDNSKNSILIDDKGKTIATLRNARGTVFSNGYSIVRTGSQSVFYDVSGKPAFADKNLPTAILTPFIEQHAVLKEGIINSEGDWTYKFDRKNQPKLSGKKISDGVILMTQTEGAKRIINITSISDGKTIASLPAEGHYHTLLGNGLLKVRRNSDNLSALFDRLGNPVTEFKYDGISEFSHGFATVRLEGSHVKHVINTSGKIIYSTPE